MIMENTNDIESLALQSVLEAFNAPLNEEQAWAIAYQCATNLQKQWNESPELCFRFNGIHSVDVHKDGSVTIKSHSGSTEQANSEHELVQSLGVVVFQALDFGLGENEEQKLSAPLENLIERMTGSESDDEGAGRTEDDNDGDEGIEHDAGDDASDNGSPRVSLGEVTSLCSCHLQNALEASTHYKAVCRALVAEAVELSTFLEKISIAKENLRTSEGDDDGAKELDDLQRADWARLWIQCLRELRQGMKLKKVEHINYHTSTEFELTPYEILMEDIRSRRYTLRQVLVNGQLPPNAKKDAHDMILEFIRSRPPLHPAKERRLKTPPPAAPDVREQLLESIRQEQKLKPTPGRIVETSRTRLDDEDDLPLPAKKVIKPDLSLLMSNSFDVDTESDEMTEDEEDHDVFDDKNRVPAVPMTPMTPLSPHTPPATSQWQQTVAAVVTDLVMEVNHPTPGRRHSITVCETPLISPTQKRNLQSSLECLSLTIEEVMHIRQVLTKAELECLLVDIELHALVAKGKICFTCKSTKFSIFGQWATKCKFCMRSVCSKCYSKMAIPTEHFEHIPVYTLSPSPISPSKANDLFGVFQKTGSAPNSPELLKREGSERPPRPPPPDLSTLSLSNNNKGKRPPLERAATTASPNVPAPASAKALEGPLMNICKDCKALIVNIIRASRVSLANSPQADKVYSDCPSRKASRNFKLDLKPMYKKH